MQKISQRGIIGAPVMIGFGVLFVGLLVGMVAVTKNQDNRNYARYMEGFEAGSGNVNRIKGTGNPDKEASNVPESGEISGTGHADPSSGNSNACANDSDCSGISKCYRGSCKSSGNAGGTDPRVGSGSPRTPISEIGASSNKPTTKPGDSAASKPATDEEKPTSQPNEDPKDRPDPKEQINRCASCNLTIGCYFQKMSTVIHSGWYNKGMAPAGWKLNANAKKCRSIPKPDYVTKADGDANCDGIVDEIDCSYVTSKKTGADFNCDGVVNGKDLAIIDPEVCVQ